MNENWVEETVEKIKKKMAASRERSQAKIPSGASNGEYDNMVLDHPEWGGISSWTNGFWAGIMWLMYEETHDARYAEVGRFTEMILDKAMEEFEGLHHDVGFMWLPSAVADYRLTGDKSARRRGLHAATILAGRFNTKGNYIKAWDVLPPIQDFSEEINANGVTIIDSMMNIPLLYWASQETGDPRFYWIAVQHAQTVQKYFVRMDGSVRHIVEFYPNTGDFVRDYGGQGFSQGSSWTRGQSWGLYGFTLSYMHTKDVSFLETAVKIADYFVSQIPENGLIPCDFNQPSGCDYEDDIAAAVASSGLIDLSEYVDSLKKKKYMEAVEKMLFALTEKSCDWDVNRDGLVKRCTTAYHLPIHNVNIVYGDYFFIEAMLKLHGSKNFMW